MNGMCFSRVYPQDLTVFLGRQEEYRLINSEQFEQFTDKW